MKVFLNLLNASFLLGLLIISSCSTDVDSPPESSETEEEMNIEEIQPDSTANYLILDSDYIFDQERLHTFELTIPQENLDFIDENPANEVYTEGKLTFEGEEVSVVGIRYKGSIGAFVGCLSGNNWTNPSGRKVCTKLSMKIKINWNDSSKKFYGLKKLQFHSMNLDPTQMHDRLGYHLFREMGVPAPRATHCRLVINGEYNGLYALVEHIDGRFIKQNFDNDDGNLYKEVWPIRSDNQLHSSNTYKDALKTNEEEANISIMEEFATELLSTPESEMSTFLDKWMNKEEIISYAVVDRLIKNDDGVFHWYCNNGQCAPHNYYWYEDPVEKKMHLIPWDLDNAFENIDEINPVTNIADEWGETSNNCLPFESGFWGIEQRSAACDKLIKSWTQLDALYESKKQSFIDGPYSAASVNNLIDTWVEQIRDATIEANDMHNDALDVNVWDQEVQRLKEAIEKMRTP